MLRQGGAEERPVDGGGGPEARQLPPQQRPMLLESRPQARRWVTHCLHMRLASYFAGRLAGRLA